MEINVVYKGEVIDKGEIGPGCSWLKSLFRGALAGEPGSRNPEASPSAAGIQLT